MLGGLLHLGDFVFVHLLVRVIDQRVGPETAQLAEFMHHWITFYIQEIEVQWSNQTVQSAQTLMKFQNTECLTAYAHLKNEREPWPTRIVLEPAQ